MAFSGSALVASYDRSSFQFVYSIIKFPGRNRDNAFVLTAYM